METKCRHRNGMRMEMTSREWEKMEISVKATSAHLQYN